LTIAIIGIIDYEKEEQADSNLADQVDSKTEFFSESSSCRFKSSLSETGKRGTGTFQDLNEVSGKRISTTASERKMY
jgi:hypothetical protein